MYYTIYKIVNQKDGKFYIGSHKTKDLNDNYMGSGKYLKHAQEKYGIENFMKEILFVFDTPELMYEKEREIVNEDFLSFENTYNLKPGGFGGWDYVNSNVTPDERSKNGKKGGLKSAENLRNNTHAMSIFKKQCSDKFKELHENGKLSSSTRFTGKKHSVESKNKISIKNKLSLLGSNNWNHGKMWITNGSSSMKVDKNSIIPEGYRRGRVMKK